MHLRVLKGDHIGKRAEGALPLILAAPQFILDLPLLAQVMQGHENTERLTLLIPNDTDRNQNRRPGGVIGMIRFQDQHLIPLFLLGLADRTGHHLPLRMDNGLDMGTDGLLRRAPGHPIKSPVGLKDVTVDIKEIDGIL